MSHEPLQCALLTAGCHWPAALTLGCPGLGFTTPEPSALRLAELENPFQPPERDRERAAIVTE